MQFLNVTETAIVYLYLCICKNCLSALELVKMNSYVKSLVVQTKVILGCKYNVVYVIYSSEG